MSVHARVDGGPEWELARGQPRPDVAATFPQAAQGPTSGFVGRESPGTLAPGIHQVTVSARDANDRTAQLERSFTVLDTAAQGTTEAELPAGLREGLLIYLHIPKTGGSSLRSVFDQVIPPARRLYVYRAPFGVEQSQVGALPADTRSRVRFLMGHLQYGIHRFFPMPSRYVTMLRDPVDRVISIYGHVTRLPKNEDQAKISRGDTTLEEFVENPTFARHNAMARLIAGVRSKSISEQELYAVAMNNIERSFVDVLLVEEMAESRRRLSQILKTELPAIPHLNVGNERSRQTLHHTLRNRIAQLNAVDVALYESLRSTFFKSR